MRYPSSRKRTKYVSTLFRPALKFNPITKSGFVASSTPFITGRPFIDQDKYIEPKKFPTFLLLSHLLFNQKRIINALRLFPNENLLTPMEKIKTVFFQLGFFLRDQGFATQKGKKLFITPKSSQNETDL